jgi:hypothetical protein
MKSYRILTIVAAIVILPPGCSRMHRKSPSPGYARDYVPGVEHSARMGAPMTEGSGPAAPMNMQMQGSAARAMTPSEGS